MNCITKNGKKKGHLRINYHAGSDTSNNKKIMELFNEDFIDKKIVIHSHEGGINAYIISKLSYNKYDYWNYDNMNNNMYPYEKMIDLNSRSTIEIIIELIRYCKNVSFIKQEKIKTIKNNIIKVDNRKQQWEKEISNDDADAFRSMRYSKQDSKHKCL